MHGKRKREEETRRDWFFFFCWFDCLPTFCLWLLQACSKNSSFAFFNRIWSFFVFSFCFCSEQSAQFTRLSKTLQGWGPMAVGSSAVPAPVRTSSPPIRFPSKSSSASRRQREAGKNRLGPVWPPRRPGSTFSTSMKMSRRLARIPMNRTDWPRAFTWSSKRGLANLACSASTWCTILTWRLVDMAVKISIAPARKVSFPFSCIFFHELMKVFLENSTEFSENILCVCQKGQLSLLLNFSTQIIVRTWKCSLVLGSLDVPLFCHWREKGKNQIAAQNEVRLLCLSLSCKKLRWVR